jgi:hypothetical protein
MGPDPNNGYPDDWENIRQNIYQRDNYTCQDCGRQGGPKGSAELHAHHIIPKSEGGSHKSGNLKTLCVSCHNNQHEHDITKISSTEPDTPKTTANSTAEDSEDSGDIEYRRDEKYNNISSSSSRSAVRNPRPKRVGRSDEPIDDSYDVTPEKDATYKFGYYTHIFGRWIVLPTIAVALFYLFTGALIYYTGTIEIPGADYPAAGVSIISGVLIARRWANTMLVGWGIVIGLVVLPSLGLFVDWVVVPDRPTIAGVRFVWLLCPLLGSLSVYVANYDRYL